MANPGPTPIVPNEPASNLKYGAIVDVIEKRIKLQIFILSVHVSLQEILISKLRQYVSFNIQLGQNFKGKDNHNPY